MEHTQIAEEIIQKIKETITSFFEDSSDNKLKVELDSDLREELRFDELALIELELWLEYKFELEVYDDVLEEFGTIQDIVDYVHSQTQLIKT